jgi:hypothetical protein
MYENRGKCIVNNRDIVILCSPRLVQAISAAFSVQFEAQKLDASVIWAGTSAKYGQGVIVIEWEGDVPEDFVDQLKREVDFIDYMLYEVPTIEGESMDAGGISGQIRPTRALMDPILEG